MRLALPSFILSLTVLHASAIAGEASAAPAKEAETSSKAVFELREASAFEVADQRFMATRGQAAPCSTQPAQAVRRYPQLKSKRPLYGSVRFGRSAANPQGGVEYHFVLDESGELPAATPEAPRYDRLYFDLNHDLDLTNDPVLGILKDPPPNANPAWKAKQMVLFDSLTVPLDHGPELGPRPFRLVPRLMVGEQDYASLFFISPVVRRGQIQIGPRQYEALLAQPYIINGRFDQPHTHLHLQPVGFTEEEDYRWGMDELGAFREMNGRYYTLSATPRGDKLTVEPYMGEMGLFTVGAGGRTLTEISITGSLRSIDRSVALGPMPAIRSSTRPAEAPQTEFRIPAGDYLPTYISVTYGRLRISISDNYHADGRPRDRGNRPRIFGIKVRPDQPFVLDFTNKPDVLFASPARNQVFRRGDEVSISAVLVDPVLDFMIRGLDDTARQEQRKVTFGEGQETTITQNVSLDPIVTITNAAGQTVFTGKLPFG